MHCSPKQRSIVVQAGFGPQATIPAAACGSTSSTATPVREARVRVSRFRLRWVVTPAQDCSTDDTMAMDDERRRKIEETLADVAHSAAREHQSPAAVAGQLVNSLQLVTANILDEFVELTDRVKQLEDRVAELEDKIDEEDDDD